jgi:hypothetical protein
MFLLSAPRTVYPLSHNSLPLCPLNLQPSACQTCPCFLPPGNCLPSILQPTDGLIQGLLLSSVLAKETVFRAGAASARAVESYEQRLSWRPTDHPTVGSPSQARNRRPRIVQYSLLSCESHKGSRQYCNKRSGEHAVMLAHPGS